MEKTTTPTIITTSAQHTTGKPDMLTGVSLREKKLAEKVKSLSERLHDLKRMTINSHIQKHMYDLQATDEWRQLHQCVTDTIADKGLTDKEKAQALMSLQDLAISYIASMAYVGALKDHYADQCYDGTSIIDACMEGFDPMNDSFLLDIPAPLTTDRVRTLLDTAREAEHMTDF